MGRPSITVERVGPEWTGFVYTFIRRWHRHHPAPVRHKVLLVARRGARIVGVATIGRPVNRVLAAQGWLKMTRVCVRPGSASWGGCSAIYRAAAEFGRVLTYTLASEPGTSLEAAGWVRASEVKGRMWKRPEHIQGVQSLMPWEKGPFVADKIRWEAPCSSL